MAYQEVSIIYEEHGGRTVYIISVLSDVDGKHLYLNKKGRLTRFRGGRCGFVSWERVKELVEDILRGDILGE